MHRGARAVERAAAGKAGGAARVVAGVVGLRRAAAVADGRLDEARAWPRPRRSARGDCIGPARRAASSASGGITTSAAARNRPAARIAAPAIASPAASARHCIGQAWHNPGARSSCRRSMSGPPRLFDRDLHRRRLDRAARGYAAAGFLKRRAAEDLVQRLEAVKRDFPVAVDLGVARRRLRRGAGAPATRPPRSGVLFADRPRPKRCWPDGPARAWSPTRSGCRSRPRASTWWSPRSPCTGPTISSAP